MINVIYVVANAMVKNLQITVILSVDRSSLVSSKN